MTHASTHQPATAPNLNDLRSHLMDTLASLRDKKNPMEVDRARAVAQVGAVLVDTARVEIDFLKATKSRTSHFMQPGVPMAAQPLEIKNTAAQDGSEVASKTPRTEGPPQPDKTLSGPQAIQTVWRPMLTDDERGVVR